MIEGKMPGTELTGLASCVHGCCSTPRSSQMHVGEQSSGCKAKCKAGRGSWIPLLTLLEEGRGGRGSHYSRTGVH